MAFLAALYDGKLGYSAQQDRNLVSSAFQSGVVKESDFKVSTATLMAVNVAAGVAVVPNTYQTILAGRYVVMSNSSFQISHPASDGSNPRIDQIFIKVYDSETGGDSSDTVQLVVVAGTPTAGCTLDTRSGAGGIPSNSLRIADVLIPAGSSSISAGNIRDRRPWARGAYKLVRIFTPISLGSSMAIMNSVSLSTRLEFSGCPVSFSLRCMLEGPSTEATSQIELEPGTAFGPENYSLLQSMGPTPARAQEAISYQWDDHVPIAGSKLIQPRGRYITTPAFVRGTSTYPCEFVVIEYPRQTADNT